MQQFGFLLGSCGSRVALTTEACLKGLPKASGAQAPTSTPHETPFVASTIGSGGSGDSNAASGGGGGGATHGSNEPAALRGWPRMHWRTTDTRLAKPSRDFSLPVLALNDETAYVEYTTDADGTVKGVCVSRNAAIAHARALSGAGGMNYCQGGCFFVGLQVGQRRSYASAFLGDAMICILDFKKDVGLWHAVLAVRRREAKAFLRNAAADNFRLFTLECAFISFLTL